MVQISSTVLQLLSSDTKKENRENEKKKRETNTGLLASICVHNWKLSAICAEVQHKLHIWYILHVT